VASSGSADVFDLPPLLFAHIDAVRMFRGRGCWAAGACTMVMDRVGEPLARAGPGAVSGSGGGCVVGGGDVPSLAEWMPILWKA